jgi:large-conductance mechanosensitive channel
MLQDIIVFAIIALVLAFLIIARLRKTKKTADKHHGCGGSGSGCDACKGDKEKPE